MGRPRLTNTHLPPGIQFKHGSYYRIVRGTWMRIGKEPDFTLAPVPEIPDWRREILAYATKVWMRARNNARGRRGLAFEIDHQDLRQMLDDAGWRCAVTGVAFDFEVVKGKRPLAPSIDRIDNSKGYVKGNCRIVSVVANYAMNVWGEEALHKMLRATVAKYRNGVN